jgi:hypothetical protein
MISLLWHIRVREGVTSTLMYDQLGIYESKSVIQINVQITHGILNAALSVRKQMFVYRS